MTDAIVHVGAHPASSCRNRAQHAHPVRRVDDLGMELHAVDAPGVVLEHGHRRVGGRRGGDEAGGGSVMASKWLIHTSWTSGASSGNSSDGPVRVQLGPAVLAAQAAPDRAAELLGDQLGAVADAEDRHAELVDRRVERRRAVDVDALRAAGQDQRRRPPRGDLGGRDAVGHDLGVHVQLADPPGDQLGVLGAEVDDEDGPSGVAGKRRPSSSDRRRRSPIALVEPKRCQRSIAARRRLPGVALVVCSP